MRRTAAVLATLAAAAAVVVANVLLLGYGGSRQDPVGKLSPRVHLAPASTTLRLGAEPPDD